jgi:hypothetical protein
MNHCSVDMRTVSQRVDDARLEATDKLASVFGQPPSVATLQTGSVLREVCLR